MNVHELKLDYKFFSAVATGAKSFEVRKDDRGFQAGDTLILREWISYGDAIPGKYTGRWVKAYVTFIMRDTTFGLREDYVIMSISVVDSGSDIKPKEIP